MFQTKKERKAVYQKKGGNFKLRLILMRSDSELQIFIYRFEKRIGLLMQSDCAKSDGTKTDGNRWPKSRDFGPKSPRRILKSKNGIGLPSSKNITEQSLVQQQYEAPGTHRCNKSSDRCVGLRV